MIYGENLCNLGYRQMKFKTGDINMKIFILGILMGTWASFAHIAKADSQCPILSGSYSDCITDEGQQAPAYRSLQISQVQDSVGVTKFHLITTDSKGNSDESDHLADGRTYTTKDEIGATKVVTDSCSGDKWFDVGAVIFVGSTGQTSSDLSLSTSYSLNSAGNLQVDLWMSSDPKTVVRTVCLKR